MNDNEVVRTYTQGWDAERKYAFALKFFRLRKVTYVNLVFTIFFGLFGVQRLYMGEGEGFLYLTLSVLGIVGVFVLRFYFTVSWLVSLLSLTLLLPAIIRTVYDLFTFKLAVFNHNTRLAKDLADRMRPKRNRKTVI
ncbi:MAG TPA: hypothetical protein PKV16_07805 [Caldisericia bacterium]|nr:hypothetical protein [Caldisericia bacterium]HPF49671.1 hypothetical protein [Caldisericia bacterium]HPI84556.1 hypothetical protein [Caldisericia bacterium]HPQ93671.1 hypothetical protein [Caldisericia bacterium]HRV74765.1 hypothetical protein [Caldisericia bacterium]